MAAYMVMAKKEWQKLFQNTLWSVQSKWMTMQRGSPYNFVYLPEGTSRVFGAAMEDRCHLIQPLFYNSQLNIIPKPTVKKCGCASDCQCGGVCEAANSMVYTTKLLFTYAGTDYYEKTWTEVCPNGDVLIYSEIPTKKYNTTTGDGGDYNNDYNDDYDIAAPPFSDLEIVTVKSQRKVCKLDVLPCGCPQESESNTILLNENCGCTINWGCGLKRRHCRQYFENIDNNYYGQIKLSECGTKLYYEPSPYWKRVSDVEIPEFLLVNSQTNGLLPTSDVLVPDYALDALNTGVYWRSVRYNTTISQVTKQDAYYQSEMEKGKLTEFLNPLSLIQIGELQDCQTKW